MSQSISEDVKIPAKVFFKTDQLTIVSTCSRISHCPIEAWSRFVSKKTIVLFFDWNPCWSKPTNYWQEAIEGPNKSNFIYLSGSRHMHKVRLDAGCNTHLISNNIHINENIFRIEPKPRSYDAVYVARAASFKRISLLSQSTNLALIVDRWFKSKYVSVDESFLQLPTPAYINDRRLSAHELCSIYNQSKSGLILSNYEGNCFSVTEYLLSGIPVVSTKPESPYGLGGRELWLNSSNSQYVEPSSNSVNTGIVDLLKRDLSPSMIRNGALRFINDQRLYIAREVIAPIFAARNVSADPVALMLEDCWEPEDPYRHKLGAEGNSMKLRDFTSLIQG